MDAGCSEASLRTSLPVAEESGAEGRVVCFVEEQEEVKTAALGEGRAGSRAKGSRQQTVTLGKGRGIFFSVRGAPRGEDPSILRQKRLLSCPCFLWLKVFDPVEEGRGVSGSGTRPSLCVWHGSAPPTQKIGVLLDCGVARVRSSGNWAKSKWLSLVTGVS